MGIIVGLPLVVHFDACKSDCTAVLLMLAALKMNKYICALLEKVFYLPEREIGFKSIFCSITSLRLTMQCVNSLLNTKCK